MPGFEGGVRVPRRESRPSKISQSEVQQIEQAVVDVAARSAERAVPAGATTGIEPV